jgi:mannan endo-1,4-beta-mannosidase
MGSESLPLFEEIHSFPNVDYLTIHIWAKNWGWFSGEKVEEGFPNVMEKATAYIDQHVAVAKKLSKPLVIEEFGLPRTSTASIHQIRQRFAINTMRRSFRTSATNLEE